MADQPDIDDFSSPHPVERITLLRELLDELNRTVPLNVLFERAGRRLGRLLCAESLSIWLRADDRLEAVVCVGSSPDRMKTDVGSGPLGLCVATRAPVYSAGLQERLDRPGLVPLGDGLFTVAVPLLVEGEACGAIRVDTYGSPLSEGDAELLLALSTGLAGAIRADRARKNGGATEPGRRAGGGTRRVVLRGKTFIGGQALGPIIALRRLPRRPIANPPDGAARAVREAFDSARRIVGQLWDRARDEGVERGADFLPLYGALIDDDRFRDSVVDWVVRGTTIHEAFARVAKETARIADASASSDRFMRQRAADMDDLFSAIAMLAYDDPRARPPRSALLVGSSLSPYDVLISLRSQPVGVVLTERTGGERSRALLKLLGLPALIDVGGVTRWVSDGDIALLDASRGFLLLNPTRTEVAALRHARRDGNTPAMAAG